MKNLSTKVKNMKIRFLTFVEKKVTTSLQTLLPYFATIQIADNIYNTLKNNDGVRKSEFYKQGFEMNSNIKSTKKFTLGYDLVFVFLHFIYFCMT